MLIHCNFSTSLSLGYPVSECKSTTGSTRLSMSSANITRSFLHSNLKACPQTRTKRLAMRHFAVRTFCECKPRCD